MKIIIRYESNNLSWQLCSTDKLLTIYSIVLLSFFIHRYIMFLTKMIFGISYFGKNFDIKQVTIDLLYEFFEQVFSILLVKRFDYRNFVNAFLIDGKTFNCLVLI